MDYVSGCSQGNLRYGLDVDQWRPVYTDVNFPLLPGLLFL
jgi:hypothetical protein